MGRRREGRSEIFGINKINVTKTFIWQPHRRATVNDGVHHDSTIFQPIVEWFDFVCDAQGEIKIRQRHANAGALTKQIQEAGNIEARADIEMRPLVALEELKQIPAGPVFNIEVLWHRGILTQQVRRRRMKTDKSLFTFPERWILSSLKVEPGKTGRQAISPQETRRMIAGTSSGQSAATGHSAGA